MSGEYFKAPLTEYCLIASVLNASAVTSVSDSDWDIDGAP